MGIKFDRYKGEWISDVTGKSYGSSTTGRQSAERAEDRFYQQKQQATQEKTRKEQATRASRAERKAREEREKRAKEQKRASDLARRNAYAKEQRTRDDRARADAESRRRYEDKMALYKSQQAQMEKARAAAQQQAQQQALAFQQQQQAALQPVTQTPAGTPGQPSAVDALQAQLLQGLGGQQNSTQAADAFYQNQAPELERKLGQALAGRGLGGQDLALALASALPQLQTQAALYGGQENRANISNILSQYGVLGQQQQQQQQLSQQARHFNLGLGQQQYEFGQNLAFNQQQAVMENFLKQQSISNQLFGGLF